MFTIHKTTGKLGHERLTIKGFKTSEAMHKFLNAQYNNDWQQSTLGLKPGTYAFVGQKWVNVKSLDPSMLNHV